MVLTASLCDASHLVEFELGKYCESICLRVAAYLSAPILDRGQNEREKKGRLAPQPYTLYNVHVLT